MLRSCRSAAFLLLLPSLIILLPARSTHAQEGTGIPLGESPAPVVRRADLVCAGFISKEKLRTQFRIVGGEKEDENFFFATTNIVYLDFGRKHGASVGDNLYVIRPKGDYENPFTGKDVGYFHEELGIVRILTVQEKTSIAEIVMSCDGMQMGDIVRPFDQYVAPPPREFVPLNRYDLPSGKLSGQIILARAHRDYLSERDVVYVDIGDERGVKLGQYYTVYRKVGDSEGPAGEIPYLKRDVAHPKGDSMSKRRTGFADDRYRGGDFSNQAPYTPRQDILDERPKLPRKVVGEVIIIRVEGRSATGVITRVTQEVNVGDYVELQ